MLDFSCSSTQLEQNTIYFSLGDLTTILDLTHIKGATSRFAYLKNLA